MTSALTVILVITAAMLTGVRQLASLLILLLLLSISRDAPSSSALLNSSPAFLERRLMEALVILVLMCFVMWEALSAGYSFKETYSELSERKLAREVAMRLSRRMPPRSSIVCADYLLQNIESETCGVLAQAEFDRISGAEVPCRDRMLSDVRASDLAGCSPAHQVLRSPRFIGMCLVMLSNARPVIAAPTIPIRGRVSRSEILRSWHTEVRVTCLLGWVLILGIALAARGVVGL